MLGSKPPPQLCVVKAACWNSVALFPQTACFKEDKSLKNILCNTNTDFFQAKAICQTSFLAYRMTKSFRCLTLLLGSACLLSNIRRILPIGNKSICSSGIISSTQWPEAGKHPCRENTGLYIPLALLLPKDKAFAFPPQTQRPHTSPTTPLTSLLRWCWLMLTKGQEHLN